MDLVQVGIVVLVVWMALAALVVALVAAAGRADRRESRERTSREGASLMPEPGRVAMRSRRSHAAVAPRRASAAG